MTDEFDSFLTRSLGVPQRDPDRAFVARVEVRIALEECIRARQSAGLRALAMQVAALFAVAAGLWWLARSADVAQLTAQSPALTLAALVGVFALLVALLSSRERPVMLNGG